ncbi:hypothetical protein DPMN_156904 [Dreissena polymorpha]|uniref:Uncharacterized protein n=1 Tax=Dreissena polymorpha TaxID=45954 RepID=A0A9D4FU03_DREPO|nr:hypothetical protein DPMN_156904 [Dreissena polymorpha]
MLKLSSILYVNAQIISFSVLEVPCEAYLTSLLTSPLHNLPSPDIIVHITPQSIIDDPRYQTFMKR